MDTGKKYVGPTEFERQTGFSKQTFYDLLSKMKQAGVTGEAAKKIDMDSAFVQNWLKTSGRTGQRKKKLQIEQGGAGGSGFTTDGLPSIEKLQHFEQYEKVRKAQIDNESKLSNLVSVELVQELVDNLDDFFYKLIVDGESSLVPEIFDKATKPDATVEECKKLYRQEITKRIKATKAKMIRHFKDMVK